MAGRVRRPDEDGLIARYFAPLAVAPGAAGLTDDAASFLAPEGYELVLTTDALVAGTHFFPDDPPDAIARKALRVNLSDLAAKGARPVGYLLTLGLTEDWSPDWLETFADGLATDQELYAISLYGGDTVKTPGPLFLSITAFGLVAEGQMPRRDRAGVGDAIYVTGTIGDAALGLKIRQDAYFKKRLRLSEAHAAHLAQRYLLPEPRVSAAPLVASYAAAAMDVSDGLVGDLARLARASGVAAILDADQVPLSGAAAAAVERDPSALAMVLTGGDDYEILLTVPPESADAFEQSASANGVRATMIGRILAAGPSPIGTVDIKRSGLPLVIDRQKYSHF